LVFYIADSNPMECFPRPTGGDGASGGSGIYELRRDALPK
jgi:hypothetical protein